MDAREKEAQAFLPSPLDTTRVFLNGELNRLCKALAKNNHNVWAKAKVQSGWSYGKSRDDTKKLHSITLSAAWSARA